MTRVPRIPPPCFEFLKSEIIEVGEGRAVVRFRPTEDMENPYGLIQGGLLAGMLDNVIGPAVFSAAPERASSTVALSIHYLAPVRAGEVLIGRAQAIKVGRTQVCLEAQLERESDGLLLVRATATNLFLG